MECEKIRGKENFDGFEIKSNNVIIKNVVVEYNASDKFNRFYSYSDGNEPISCEKNVDLYFSFIYDKREYSNNIVLLYNDMIMFAGVEENCGRLEYHIWGYMSTADKDKINSQGVAVLTVFNSIFRRDGNYTGYIWNNRNMFVRGYDNFRRCEAKHIDGDLKYTYVTFPMSWVNGENVNSFDKLLSLVTLDKQYDLVAIEHELRTTKEYVEGKLLDNIVNLYDGISGYCNYVRGFIDKARLLKEVDESKLNFKEKTIVRIYNDLCDAEYQFRQKKAVNDNVCNGIVAKYGQAMEGLLKLCLVRPISYEEIKDQICKNKNNIGDVELEDEIARIRTYIECVAESNNSKKGYDIYSYINLIQGSKSDEDKYQLITIGNFPFIITPRKVKCKEEIIINKFKEDNNIICGGVINEQKVNEYNAYISNIVKYRIGDGGCVKLLDSVNEKYKYDEKTREYVEKNIKTYIEKNVKSETTSIIEDVLDMRNQDSHSMPMVFMEHVIDMRRYIYGNGVFFENILLDYNQRKLFGVMTCENSLMWKILSRNWDELEEQLNKEK